MDQETIYRLHAREYEELISAEDCDGLITSALSGIATLEGATIVDVGCGTGRIARLVAPLAKRVIGVEPEAAMRAVAEEKLRGANGKNWEILSGNASALPVATEIADVVVAAWVFGHFRQWMPSDWKATVRRALGEMDRVARPDAALVIIETLGTGCEKPAAPNEGLAEYYAWLEREQGFTRVEIQTDYQFANVADAARICGFFFGDELARTITEKNWTRVPEWTGIWSRRTDSE